MRLTISSKVSILVMALEIIGFSILTYLVSWECYTRDLAHIRQTQAVDRAAILSSRLRSELREIFTQGSAIAGVSLEEFRYPDDRIRFVQRLLRASPMILGISVLSATTPGEAPVLKWRAVNPGSKEGTILSAQAWEKLERSHPIDLGLTRGGDAILVPAKLASGLPILRLAVPFARDQEGNYLQFYVLEIEQERLSSALFESTSFSAILTNSEGQVLATNDPIAYPLGKDLRAWGPYRSIKGPTVAGTLEGAGYSPLGSLGMAVFTLPFSDPYQDRVSAALRTAGLFSAIIILLSLIMAQIFSRSLTRPIQLLTYLSGEIRRGNFSVGRQIIIRDRSDEIHELNSAFKEMAEGLEERAHLMTTFSKFHSKEVAEKMLRGELKLGGEEKEAVVLFTDVRGFSTLSGKMTPDRVVALLNRYMTRMVAIILEQGGIVDKFIGDSILALWGVPFGRIDDPERAIQACLSMRVALAQLNSELIKEGYEPLWMGMGLNHGKLIAGNIGSDERMEYTVIGEPVNTAYRVQQLTKKYGTDLLATQAMINLVPSRFIIRKAGEEMIAGKQDPLSAYQILGYLEHGTPHLVQTPYSTYEPEQRALSPALDLPLIPLDPDSSVVEEEQTKIFYHPALNPGMKEPPAPPSFVSKERMEEGETEEFFSHPTEENSPLEDPDSLAEREEAPVLEPASQPLEATAIIDLTSLEVDDESSDALDRVRTTGLEAKEGGKEPTLPDFQTPKGGKRAA